MTAYPVISPNVHVLTTDDLKAIEQRAFARGVERGLFEAGASRRQIAASARSKGMILRTQSNCSFEEGDQGSAIIERFKGEALCEFADEIERPLSFESPIKSPVAETQTGRKA